MKALHLGVGLALLTAAPAVATPGSGIHVETLSKNTVNGVDYTVTRITVAPGGATGWHYHPGEVFGFIAESAMTHWSVSPAGGCVVDAVYDAGAPVKEGVGAGFVHNGRNETGVPLVMEVVYINPTGAPLSVEVPEPAGCSVQ